MEEGQAGEALHETATKKCRLYAWPPVRLSKASSAAVIRGSTHGVPVTDDHGIVRTTHDVIRHGSGSRNRWTVTVQGNEAHPMDELVTRLRVWAGANDWLIEEAQPARLCTHAPRWRATSEIWRLITINVGSMTAADRRLALHTQFLHYAAAAICMQETRLTEEPTEADALAEDYDLHFQDAEDARDSKGRLGLAIAVHRLFVSQRIQTVRSKWTMAVRLHTGRRDAPCIIIANTYLPTTQRRGLKQHMTQWRRSATSDSGIRPHR